MKVVIISHTYIAPINRDKWKIFATMHPDVSLWVIFPRHWPTTLFSHEAVVSDFEQLPNCQFIALDAQKEGNEVLYGYSFSLLYRLMKKIRPDLIHVEQGEAAFSYFQAIICNKLLRLHAKNIFFTWINWHPEQTLKYRLLWKPIERFNRNHSAGAIVGSERAKEILEEKKFKKPIVVLPQLGVNTSVFKPALRVERALFRKKFHIGFIGRLVPEKGIFLLLDAFIKLSHQFPDWSLVFVGDGPSLDQLQIHVVEHNLARQVLFHPPVEHHDVAALLSDIDILVLPSFDTIQWTEQFGHVLIEAMACKIPVIGSTAGQIPYIIGSGGLIFEQKNQESLLAQLQSLMQDEEKRKHLGKHGYERVLAEYSHEVIADKTYDFWHRVMNAKHF